MTEVKLLILLFIFLVLFSSVMAAESAGGYDMVESGKCLVELKSPVPAEIININGMISAGQADLDGVLSMLEAYEFRLKAPRYQPNLYTLLFNADFSVAAALEELKKCASVGAVYPCPLVKSFDFSFHPDDFLYPSQWHLTNIHAPEAWAICRGDTQVEVGIIDSGVNYEHPDLAPNIWINPGEDLDGNGIIDLFDWNGLDDDGNGYVDDFWGWDWVSVPPSFVWPGEDPGPPDNDPMDFGGHGTHCAGDACAATDNLEGVTSPGFNCRIMCLRAGYTEAGSGQGLVSLDASIEAVYYAIDMGAEILSMSFGGPSLWAPLQTALETAADSGLVLVAAAGNDDNNQIQYPAGYDCVIAVAATTFGDIKADFSSYGAWVTICAPGDQIYSTIPDGYGNMSGTSMSSPVTAGLCALIKGLKPEWNYQEVTDWLTATADDIDYLNPAYAGQLGGGRINAYKAVDLYLAVDSLWVELPVDQVRLPFNTEGYLAAHYHKAVNQANNVYLSFSSANPRVHLTGQYYIGNISAGGEGIASGFSITVDYGGLDFETVDICADFSCDEFNFSQSLELPVGYAEVLILDGDQNNTETTAYYYEQALADLGYSSETWRLSEMDCLNFSMFSPAAVIAFSGTAEDSIFTQQEWNALQDYFYAGGRLIISGQNIAQDCAANYPAVLSNFLWSNFVSEHSNDLTINGNPDYIPAQGMYFVMAGSGGAWNQTSLDVITPLTIAQTVFLYNTANPQNAAGIYWQSAQGKMFFCSFGIEGINDNASSGNSKAEALEMMFEVFGLNEVETPGVMMLPAAAELQPPFPNPFNGSVAFDFSLAKSGKTTVIIYDLLGRETVRLWDDDINAGSHTLEWNAAANIASGIYFIELRTEDTALRRKVLLLK